MQEAMTKWTQMQTVYVIPLMVGFGAYSFSAGLGIYWLMQNILAIIQTIVQYRHADGKMDIESIKEDFNKLRSKFLTFNSQPTKV
jgi:membrane protein insertase Oxa1/YidC/SpoIIIJ